MDEWNQNNPGGLVFVVQARDVESPQGKWIQNMLSIDFENELGERYFLEDEQLQFFYVDMDAPYDQELSGENWPHRTTCNEPLQTDAQKQGEYCCWIIKAGCGFLNWHSCRFRIKDDCNNWTRSENLVPGGNVSVEITEPLDESEHEWGTPVFCHANVNGSPSYENLGDYIKWSVRPSGGTIWYGPNEPWEYHDWTEVIDSYISDTVWIGQNFYIDSFEDCLGLEIKARLDVCGFSLDDTCTIYIPGVRSGQAWTEEGLSLDIQQEAYVNSDGKKVYWIDGPAIPWSESNDWYNGCLEDYRLSKTPPPPSEANLSVGKIRMRVCVYNPCVDKYIIEAILPDLTAQQILVVLREEFQNGKYCNPPSFYSWDISGKNCGNYRIRVKGFSNEELLTTVISDVFYLDKVKKNDLLKLKEMFSDIKYSQLDCSAFVHQLLILLARKELVELPGDPPGTAGNYPPVKIFAIDWRPGNGTDRNRIKKIEFSELQPGDLIVWGFPNHVGIFVKWDPKYANKKDIYRALILESCPANTGKLIGVESYKLGTEEEPTYNSDNEERWHYAVTWRDDQDINIFKSCN